MSDSDQQTCGKGLAENSILPAKLGELISAMAANLAPTGRHWTSPTRIHGQKMQPTKSC